MCGYGTMPIGLSFHPTQSALIEVTMPFDAFKLARYRVGMRRRIEALQRKTETCVDVAMDHMMLDRVDSYFRVEQGLAEIDRALHLIAEELPNVQNLSSASRLESRLEFIEDRWEELDSEVRERPRRRRRRINVTDFFNAAGGHAEQPGARGAINNIPEAYQVLGLQFGSSLFAVTRAFRQRAKKLHPDVREGDRTAEPELRRIIEAYQYLKESLSFSHTAPPRTP